MAHAQTHRLFKEQILCKKSHAPDTCVFIGTSWGRGGAGVLLTLFVLVHQVEMGAEILHPSQAPHLGAARGAYAAGVWLTPGVTGHWRPSAAPHVCDVMWRDPLILVCPELFRRKPKVLRLRTPSVL